MDMLKIWYLTIPAGALSGVIPVTVVGDNKPEMDEVFYVNLSNAVRATIARSTGGAAGGSPRGRAWRGGDGVHERLDAARPGATTADSSRRHPPSAT